VDTAGAHANGDPAPETAILVSSDVESDPPRDALRKSGEGGILLCGHALVSRVSRLARAS